MVYTFGTSKPDNIETTIVEIGLELKSGFIMQLKANVPRITGIIQRTPIKNKLREELSRYELADSVPIATENTHIDLLIGNDYYAEIVSLQKVCVGDGLYLLQSKLGWILSGRKDESHNRTMG